MMLIHHFEAETQGLLTKMTKGKAKSPNNSHFMKGTFFLRGFQSEESGRIKATGSPMHIINENIFVFDLAGGHPKSSNFS